MYLSWASFYEGKSDRNYFDVLIPRLMDDIVRLDGISQITIPDNPAIAIGLESRSVDDVAKEACENREAYYIIFVHADTGGRSLANGIGSRSEAYCEAIGARCDWPAERCILIKPRHETEAWILADPQSVLSALGYRGTADEIGLPLDGAAAERLQDPKATLASAARQVRGRRRSGDVSTIFATIAQNQSFQALRRAPSFIDFEAQLRRALASLGCIPQLS